jgi:hypothetical protein
MTTCSADDLELARSILACPAEVELVVDGHPHVGADSQLGLRDDAGTPTFWCRPGSLMARAAGEGSSALVTFASGVGAEGSSERRAALTVAGRLQGQGTAACACCGELRLDVGLDLDFVVLHRDDTQVRVPLRAFRSPELVLNRGYLQRSMEHANDCHREDLGQVVARTTGTPVEQLLDVCLTDLTAHGAELGWIDVDGAHRASLWFSRPARTAEELGLLLRHELHAGIC